MQADEAKSTVLLDYDDNGSVYDCMETGTFKKYGCRNSGVDCICGDLYVDLQGRSEEDFINS